MMCSRSESGVNPGPMFLLADIAEEFTPNDFELRRPDWFVARRLRRAITKMKDFAHQTLLDPALAVEAPWNDVAHRSGLVSRE